MNASHDAPQCSKYETCKTDGVIITGVVYTSK